MIAFYSLWHARLHITLLVAAWLSACSLPNQELEGKVAQRLVLQNVSLIRSPHAPVEEASHVVVENGRISALGAGHYNAAPGDLVVDGEGHFVSPGLIDMHVHVFDPSDLLLLLAHGVTTARQMSGERKLLHFRERVKKGDMPGPTLVVASPVLNQRSGYASGSQHRFVENPNHARQLVTRYHRMGYELIKVYDGLSLDVYAAIVEASAEHNLPIAGHPSFNFPIRDFITPRLQSIEHTEMLFQAPLGYSYEPDALQTLVEDIGQRSFYVTPTLVVFDDLARLASDSETFLETLDDGYINPHLRQRLQPMLNDISHSDDAAAWSRKSRYLGEISRVLNVHGIPLLIGSDSGYVTVSGSGTVREMKLLHQAGITTENVLQFATENAARALGRGSDFGALSLGMQADLVITRSDPRRNLDAYYSLQGVLADGVYWDAQAIAAMKEGAKVHMTWLETLRWYVIERVDLWRDS